MNRKKTVQNKCRTIKHCQLKSRPKCENYDYCQFSSRFNSVNTKDCTRRRAPGSHQAGEIWLRSFISTVRPSVHINPSGRRNFTKKLFKPELFENASFRFRVNGKQFEKGTFWNDGATKIVSFLTLSYLKNDKLPVEDASLAQYPRAKHDVTLRSVNFPHQRL